MKSHRALVTFVSIVLIPCAAAVAQLAGPIYTWDNSGNPSPSIENWVKNFGTNSVTLDNNNPGELTIVETGTPGEDVSISDGANRVRESALNASGGTDITGLTFLEFDLGHNGTTPINVQFYVQASTGFTFVALGPDLAVTPGMNTYQVPLAGLTPEQAVYVRTFGFNARDHLADGNVIWTLREIRSIGQTLTSRTLVDHNVGSAEGGLQGAIVNFDNAAVQGNNGGQNQTGLSHNAGNGSLQWTDLGGSNGAAISWGNGTAWSGNTFNNRTTDVSSYDLVTIRISATDPTGGGGIVGFSAFLQADNFAFQSIEGGASRDIPIDGQFHDFVFSLAGMVNTNVVDQTGINIFSHPQNLVIQVDSIIYSVIPEPMFASSFAAIGALALMRRRRVA